jgi:hypothetical protein
MSDGLQRTCPTCAELNEPDRAICSECGAWLIPPRRIRGSELEQILNDWYRSDRPKRIVDPERHERELREWDESRAREQAERERVSEMWRRRRQRWDRFKRGDTSHGAAADTAQKQPRGGPG